MARYAIGTVTVTDLLDGASAWFKWDGSNLLTKVQAVSPGVGWFQDDATGVDLQGISGDATYTYTWIKYSEFSTGKNASGISNMVDTWSAGKYYVGIAANKTLATESDEADDYEWVRLEGVDGTSVTISSTSTTNGVTTVTFSDGTDITVNDGATGASSGALILYTDSDNPADNTEVYTVQSTHTYVYYYEWSGDPLTTIPTDAHTKTFVKFIGDDGSGVVPIFSPVVNPDSSTVLSFDPGSNEYVTFYEYTGAKPTTIPTLAHQETFVQFVGADGSAAYTYDSVAGDAIPAAAAIGDTLVDIGLDNKLYIAESANADEIKVGEWVPFDASYVGAAPGSIMYDTTTINGGAIQTGTITLHPHEVGVGTDGSIFGAKMVLTANRLEVYDASGVLRVRIGNL
jgi:hypothetical protein